MKNKIQELRAYVKELVDRDGVAIHGACLYHALAAQKLLGAEVVAGSLSWKFTSLDNGSNPTHFSYIFEPHKVPLYLALGVFPEMHVWNVLNGKVLDFTTCYLPKQASLLCGFAWETLILPPDYHFGKTKNKTQDFLYVENPIATQLARKWSMDIA